MRDNVRINNQIRASELRVIGFDGSNLGVLKKEVAIEKAQDAGLDLIEISPNANPPVARITDYGKFQYEQKKKMKEQKAKSHAIETKVLQVKIGTGDHDLALKAKKASAFLAEGHRVKLELFLAGRAKGLNKEFQQSRLERIVNLITEPYKIVEEPKKSPKGLSMIVEKDKSK